MPPAGAGIGEGVGVASDVGDFVTVSVVALMDAGQAAEVGSSFTAGHRAFPVA